MEFPWNLVLAEGFWAPGQTWGDLASQKDVQFSDQHAGDNGEPLGVSDEQGPLWPRQFSYAELWTSC